MDDSSRRMSGINMQLLLYVYIMSLSILDATEETSTNFNITLKAPETLSSPLPMAYRTVHIQYTVPNDKDRWNIVAIEPFILRFNRTVRQLNVHICQFTNSFRQQNSVWYDDRTSCRGSPSMLIYHWAAPSPLTKFQTLNNLGFQLDKSKSIVLTVIYVQEQYVHKEQPRVVFYISSLIPRYHLGSLEIEGKHRITRLSCRVSDYPRLLYSVKPLFSIIKHDWWHLYVIRNRSFGRKIIQPVLDSTTFFELNNSDVEVLSSDIFLVSGDYILGECDDKHEFTCNFLVFYAYKNTLSKSSTEHVHYCQQNNYPDLFKLIPKRDEVSTTARPSILSNVDSSTMFLLICLLIIVIWISIIVGCIIMRRIRGLVNFRTEPSSPIGARETRPIFGQRGNEQRLVAEGDHIAQLDVEHMGLMS
ncbi:unnamed protein product [Adineta ricciae]|uniref:Uncharacterized protein n=1 Tax=Adineta ricciae TaxID=249248 RepID=A0A813UEP7_ADIRI|nr:unnamed protein product [Adineta ricciae]